MSRKTAPQPHGPPSIANYIKEFIKIIERLDTSKPTWTLFQSFARIGACAIHQAPYHDLLCPIDDTFHTVEKEYMEAIRGYSRDQLNRFAELIAITRMALSVQYTDFLGHLFMSLELGNSAQGQFFTSFELSYLIACMTLTNIGETINQKGFITLCEPAIGAGGMMIAAARCLQDDGYNLAEHAFFVGTDVSQTAFDMSYIQLGLIGFPGIVRHGNTLSNEIWDSWFTPICRVYPARTRMFLDSLSAPTTEPEPVQELPTGPEPIPAQIPLILTPTQPGPKPTKRGAIAPITEKEHQQFVQASLF